MGRSAKLSDRQKAEIIRRLIAKESAAKLIKEFKISKSLFYSLFSGQISGIQEDAKVLADAELRVASYPISGQVAIRTLADQLKDIENSYANGAAAGARSADRLHNLADRASARLVQRADEEDGLDPKDVALVSALHQTANQGATMASNMIAANRAAVPTTPSERPRSDLSRLTKKELAELERLTRKAENG